MSERQPNTHSIGNAATLLEIFDMLPTSMFVKNERLQFEFSNAAHCEIIGASSEELIGRSDADFYPPEEAAGFLSRDRAVLETGVTSAIEETATGRGGESKRYLTRKARLISGDGRIYLIGTNTDLSEVSELKRINDDITRLNLELAENMRKLREAQDELVERGKLAQLGQLIATVAHEIRNPLGAVRTAAFLLARKTRDKGLNIQPQLDRIDSGVSRCDAIITQLLDFARNNTLQYGSFDLNSWLRKTVDEEAAKLPGAVTVECRLGLAGALAQFDPARLSRAVINLVSNASEALVGKGGDPALSGIAEPRIVIATRASGGHAEIAVLDNGPGITPANMKRIFEPLFTTKSFGTGLGLPAVRKIIEQHNGTLTATSNPGAGATFTIRIPWTQPAAEAA